MTEFAITAERSPDWDDAEVRCRLVRAYALILNYRPKNKDLGTADRGEFGDLTRPAASGIPVTETEKHESV